MPQPESKLILAFRKIVEPLPYHWDGEKLHGGLYQSGLPDTVWTKPDGKQIWIEFKVAPRWRLELLQGRQRLVCLRWATRGVPVYVLGQDITGGWLMDLRTFVTNPDILSLIAAGPVWLSDLVRYIK